MHQDRYSEREMGAGRRAENRARARGSTLDTATRSLFKGGLFKINREEGGTAEF